MDEILCSLNDQQIILICYSAVLASAALMINYLYSQYRKYNPKQTKGDDRHNIQY